MKIFLSHSSKDNAQAIAMRDWLVEEGWKDEVFLDLDPERGIVAGERWEKALHEAANRCEVVLFMVSKNWLASDWCVKELDLAHKLNLRMFGVLVDDIPIEDIPLTLSRYWQLVNLAAGKDHHQFTVTLPITHEEAYVSFSQEGLQRLRHGLVKAGLDPKYFPWPPENDPNRSPYPGLAPLEKEDAGIFFGRDGKIIEAMRTLRGLKEGAPPRLMVILGASGAGKSSFMRAGLLWRLERDDRNFLPLPIIRPEKAVLNHPKTGLVACLEQAFRSQDIPRTRAEIKEAIAGGVPTLQPLLSKLATQARPVHIKDDTEDKTAAKPPMLILPIDQGEELFQTEGAEEAQHFLSLLAGLLVEDSPALTVLFTIRSDNYEQLQNTEALEDIRKETFDLGPMPKGAYSQIITAPALRLKNTDRPLKIEDQLVETLLKDIEQGGSKDALPLLAFTLERLYVEHGGDGDLKLSEYEQLGKIRGSIEAAVKKAMQAADQLSIIPKDEKSRQALLKRGLIPWLAGIDPDSGAPRRQVAKWSDIPKESQPLIALLVDQRLLATDIDKTTGEKTIEPAHESLLRQWGQLEDWLEEDFEDLATLEGVKRAARDWMANDKDKEWLAHAGGRLEAAEKVAIREDFSAVLSIDERGYLSAAKQNRDDRLKRQKRTSRILLWGAIAASIILASFAVFSRMQWFRAQEQARVAKKKTQQAHANLKRAQITQSQFLADLSKQQATQDDPTRGILLALEALPDTSEKIERPYVAEAESRLYESWNKYQNYKIITQYSNIISAKFSPNGNHILILDKLGKMRLIDWRTEKEILCLTPNINEREFFGTPKLTFSHDGTRILISSEDDNFLRLYDAISGNLIGKLLSQKQRTRPFLAEFSRDGKTIIVTGVESTPLLFRAETGKHISTKVNVKPLAIINYAPDGNKSISDPDRKRILVIDTKENTIWVKDINTKKIITSLKSTINNEIFTSAIFSPNGKRILSLNFTPLVVAETTNSDLQAQVWDSKTGKLLFNLKHEQRVNSANFSKDGQKIVTASNDGTVKVWNTRSKNVLIFRAGSQVSLAEFSHDNRFVLITLWDGIRVWDTKQKSSKDFINPASFVPSNRKIKTTINDHQVDIYNSLTHEHLFTLKHAVAVRSVLFSPNGRKIMTTTDSKVIVWDGNTGTIMSTLQTSNQHSVFNTSSFSHDGKMIVTNDGLSGVNVWNSNTGERLFSLEPNYPQTFFSAFSSDDRWIITGSSRQRTGRAIVWDVRTQKPIWFLEEDEAISNIYLSKNMIIVNYGDKKRYFKILSGTLQEKISHVKESIVECLTPEDRTSFFLPPEPPAWCIEMEKWPYHTQKWKDWLVAKKAGENPPLPKQVSAIP